MHDGLLCRAQAGMTVFVSRLRLLLRTPCRDRIKLLLALSIRAVVFGAGVGGCSAAVRHERWRKPTPPQGLARWWGTLDKCLLGHDPTRTTKAVKVL